MKIKVKFTEEELKTIKQFCETARDNDNIGCFRCKYEDQCNILYVVQSECRFQYVYDPIDFSEERMKEIMKQNNKEINV